MNRSALFCIAGVALWLCAGILPASAAHPDAPTFKVTSRVFDSAHVFRPAGLRQLTAYVEDGEYYTGDQIIIGIVPSFGGKTANEYAASAAQAAGLGAQKPGVLLVISQKERDARIVAAPQLAAVLPPEVQQAILSRIVVPNLKQGTVEKGVMDGVGSIIMALQAQYTPQYAAAQSSGGGLGDIDLSEWTPAAVLGVLIILGFLFGRRPSIIGMFMLGNMMSGDSSRRW